MVGRAKQSQMCCEMEGKFYTAFNKKYIESDFVFQAIDPNSNGRVLWQGEKGV